MGPTFFHFPLIIKGSCDNLQCETPPCLVRSGMTRFRCVATWEYVNGEWVYRGFRLVRYQDHLRCECKQCSDITTRFQCMRTRPCPNNSSSPNNYCFWRCRSRQTAGPSPIPITIGPAGPQPVGPGPIGSLSVNSSTIMSESWDPELSKTDESSDYAPVEDVDMQQTSANLPCCDCCQPIRCPPHYTFNRAHCRCVCTRVCRPPLILNRRTCECGCPRGSWLSYTQDCIGA